MSRYKNGGAAKGPGRDRAKERGWRKLLARWRRSGQSVKTFCAAENVKEASFYAWRRELCERDRERESEAGPTPAFVRLIPGAAADRPLVSPPLELTLPGGQVLRIPPGCDRSTLAMVLSVLEQRPC